MAPLLRAGTLAVLLALTPSVARAADPERANAGATVVDPVDAAADAAIEAAGIGAAAIPTALGRVDPWRVVDVLLARGRQDVASAVAATVDGADAASLRAFAAHTFREPRGYRARLDAAVHAWRVDKTADAETTVVALAGAEAIPEGVLRVRWLGAHGDALLDVGRGAEAATTLREGAEVAERVGWLAQAASLWGRAGSAHGRDRDLASAADAFRRQAEIHQKTGDRVRRAMATADMGLALRRIGDLGPAVAAYGTALDALEPTTRPTVRATILARRAGALSAGGDFAGAFRDIAAALGALDTQGPPTATRERALARVESQMALATLFNRLGDVVRARASARSALAILDGESVLATPTGTDAKGRARVEQERARHGAVARATLAVSDLLAEEYDAAAVAFTALEAEFAALGDLRQAGHAEQNLGEVRLRQGRWNEANLHSIAASAVLAAEGDAEGELLALGNHAVAEERLGRREKAAETHRVVLERAARLGLQSIVLEQCVRLARTRLALRFEEGALQAVERGTRVLSGVFGGLPDADRVGARALFAELFEVGMEVAAARGDEAQFFRYLESGRAGALVDGLANRAGAATRRLDPDLERRRATAARTLAVTRSQRDEAAQWLRSEGTSTATPDGARERYRAIERAAAAARQDHEDIVREIQRTQRAASYVLYPEPDTLADAAAGLADDEAVVEYTTVRDDSIAFVLTRGGGKRIRLGTVAEVAALDDVDAWHTTAGNDDDARAAAAEATATARRRVWEPVLAALPARTRLVYISPDTYVRRVPFAALAEGERALDIAYIPSATVLGLLRADAARRGARPLAFGVTKYTPSGSAMSLLGTRGPLIDLPHAAEEARSVGGVVRIDDEATEDELRRLAATGERWSAAHFACHGLVDVVTPRLSSIALRSGPSEDGYTTATEILDLGLRADVVVLSACDTGWGGTQRGEGIVALARAFLFAGSPRVLASLWPVEDVSTATFMQAFHAAWKRGDDAPTAHRAGVDAVRAHPRYRHPKYWAAWVLWGVASSSAPGGT